MPTLIWLALGLVAGSAANAVIDRFPRRESWWAGRSRCDKCRHVLGFLDLIPVLSYLFLRGKCRFCHRTIAVRNLLVELIMILGFLALSTWHLALIFWVTVVIAAIDWETQLVPDSLMLIWGGLAVVSSGIGMGNVWGAVAAVGVIGGIWVLTRKRGMGDGDIGIAAVMGWWLGWPKIAPALWISFVAGAVYGLWLLVHGRKTMKSKIAFGPWLILGAWVGHVWGDRIIRYVFRT